MEMNNCDPSEFFPGADVVWDDSPDKSSGTDENEPVYSIGELAKKFGISLRTLRFYESRDLLSPGRKRRRRVYERKLGEIEEALAELRWIYTSLSAQIVQVRPAGEEKP